MKTVERPSWDCACPLDHFETSGRAWCPDCSEWCYPNPEMRCVRGREPALEAEIEHLRKLLTRSEEKERLLRQEAGDDMVVITFAEGHLHLPADLPRTTRISDAMLRELVDLANDSCDEVERLRIDLGKSDADRLVKQAEIERLQGLNDLARAVHVHDLEVREEQRREVGRLRTALETRPLVQGSVAAYWKDEAERLRAHLRDHHCSSVDDPTIHPTSEDEG